MNLLVIPDNMIEVKNVSVCYNSTKERIDNLKEYIIRFSRKSFYFEEFWALKNISFEVKRGKILGIIGNNGAGKSTLLKTIACVIKPTSGSVSIYGSMAPLIELGAGFDTNLSGSENIFLNAALLGYSRQYIKDRYNEIIEFSELQNFIDLPLKNYSSGMVARLGFAIATAVEPDILLVDEILSVGDIKFQQKCQSKMQNLIKKHTTLVIVSHSIDQVEHLASQVVWLENGLVKMIGDPEEVCSQYRKS